MPLRHQIARFSRLLTCNLLIQLRSAYLGLLMMCGLHLYMGYTQPLFVQGIMGIKNLYDAKPVALYILGKKAEGDLKRPFKAAGMFGG